MNNERASHPHLSPSVCTSNKGLGVPLNDIFSNYYFEAYLVVQRDVYLQFLRTSKRVVEYLDNLALTA